MATCSTIGVDLGGTKIHAVRLSPSNGIEDQVLVPTPRDKAGVLSEIASVVGYLRAKNTRAIGIGVPGPVDFRSQTVRVMPNLPGWKNAPLASEISRRAKLPCAIDNDAKCFLRAEMAEGAAKGAKDAVGVVVGTGIGGAIAINGEICRGANGFAGEFGHTILSDREGNPAARNAGSFEALASGEAIRYRALSLLSSGRRSRSVLRAEGLVAKDVFDAGREGDAVAEAAVSEAAYFLGIGLSNIVNSLNPEVIVMGGSVSKQLGILLPTVRAQIRRNCFSPASSVRVVRQKLAHPGAVGAALLVRK